MAVRILSTIEHTLGADLAGMGNDEKHTLSGAELNIIRSEILNAAGDTTRALSSLVSTPKAGARRKVSVPRDVMSALSNSLVDIIDSEGMNTPIFKVTGDFNLLSKIRNEIGAGVVYNKTYACVGLNDIVNSLMPFLDPIQSAGIKIAKGDYRDWRDAVCEIYLEGLGDE
jgi:hypothetical protein